MPAALRAYSVKGHIAIMEPYYPTIEPRLTSFFGEFGYEVARIVSLKAANPVDYGQATAQQTVQWIKDLDGPDVEALVQFGTNLPKAQLAAEAERWLEKPVVAINCWQSAQVGQIRTREDYYYEELRGSSLRDLL